MEGGIRGTDCGVDSWLRYLAACVANVAMKVFQSYWAGEAAGGFGALSRDGGCVFQLFQSEGVAVGGGPVKKISAFGMED